MLACGNFSIFELKLITSQKCWYLRPFLGVLVLVRPTLYIARNTTWTLQIDLFKDGVKICLTWHTCVVYFARCTKTIIWEYTYRQSNYGLSQSMVLLKSCIISSLIIGHNFDGIHNYFVNRATNTFTPCYGDGTYGTSVMILLCMFGAKDIRKNHINTCKIRGTCILTCSEVSEEMSKGC